jgi:hypothetical protein
MSGGSQNYGTIARHIPRNVEELSVIDLAGAVRQLRKEGLREVAEDLLVIVMRVTDDLCAGYSVDPEEFYLASMGELLEVLDRAAAGDDGPEDREAAIEKWRRQNGYGPTKEVMR